MGMRKKKSKREELLERVELVHEWMLNGLSRKEMRATREYTQWNITRQELENYIAHVHRTLARDHTADDTAGALTHIARLDALYKKALDENNLRLAFQILNEKARIRGYNDMTRIHVKDLVDTSLPSDEAHVRQVSDALTDEEVQTLETLTDRFGLEQVVTAMSEYGRLLLHPDVKEGAEEYAEDDGTLTELLEDVKNNEWHLTINEKNARFWRDTSQLMKLAKSLKRRENSDSLLLFTEK